MNTGWAVTSDLLTLVKNCCTLIYVLKLGKDLTNHIRRKHFELNCNLESKIDKLNNTIYKNLLTLKEMEWSKYFVFTERTIIQ